MPFKDLKGSTSHYRPGTILDIPRHEKHTSTLELKTWKTITSELGHHSIDYLKMDIEGGELLILEDILNSEITVKQIVLELHPHIYNLQHHGSLLGAYGWEVMQKLLAQFKDHHYTIAWVSPRKTEYLFTLEA